MKKTYYIKLIEDGIEAFSFGFYGNDCYYYVEIFDEEKKKIGYGRLNVENMGTEPNDEFIYDYNCNDEEDRESLANILGIDKIEADWYNDEGQLVIDKYDDECNMPEEVINKIWDNIAESDKSDMLDYYYEEFGEMADDEGYVSLDEFIRTHNLMKDVSLKGDCFSHRSDWESVDDEDELVEFFDECGYAEIERSLPDNISESEGEYLKALNNYKKFIQDKQDAGELFTLTYFNPMWFSVDILEHVEPICALDSGYEQRFGASVDYINEMQEEEKLKFIEDNKDNREIQNFIEMVEVYNSLKALYDKMMTED